MDVAQKYPSLEDRQWDLGISKETHPTEVAWLEKNGDLVPWDRVKTLDQLREFVGQRVAQRMELGQYALTAEGTILAEQSEMRTLTIKARKGDLEAVRAIELYRKGGWEMVLKGHFNSKRELNLDLWKWYLTEENLEFAEDPFWQDLVWDIPVSYLQERGNFGIGKIADLKPGVLDKLRDDIEFENIDLPKAYRELTQQLAASSEEDLPRDRGEKSWVYIPGRKEDPINYEANVQELDKLASNRFDTKYLNGQSLLKDSSFWLLRDKRKMKVAIRIRSRLVWVKTEFDRPEILDEYIDDVLSLLRQKKVPGAELFIAKHEQDPKRQMEIAQGKNPEVLEMLAKNEKLHPEVQVFLAKCGKVSVQSSLASRTELVPEAQMFLANVNNFEIQWLLATNTNTCPAAQLILVNSVFTSIKGFLALNPSIPHEAQIIIAKCEDTQSQVNLASNRSIVEEAQLILAKCKDMKVQKKLARNPRITPKTQLTLAESEYNETRQYLAQNKSITKRVQLILAKSEDRETKARLANNPNIHLKAQLLLAKSKDEYVQGILAQNESIADDVQILLAKSENKWTLIGLAKRKNLCHPAQLILAASPLKDVQEALAKNPHLAKQAHTVAQGSNLGLEKSKQEARKLDEAKTQAMESIQTR